MSHLQLDVFPVKAYVNVFICQVQTEDQKEACRQIDSHLK